MNKVILLGRLCADPDVKYTQANPSTCIARFRMAVDRPVKKEGESSADFIPCVAFGKTGEFVEKYLKKGIKVALEGRWQTGSFTNKEGTKTYSNDCVVDRIEFAESKKTAGDVVEDMVSVPASDDGLPF